MFETLAKGFRAAKQKLSGVAELTDDVIDDALRDVRMSLLEADVEFKVTKRFLDRVKEAARGEQVQLKAKSKEYGVKTITPEQAFVKICQDELTEMMGPVDTELKLGQEGPDRDHDGRPAGLGQDDHRRQARQLPRASHDKKPLLVAADIYRPAAVDQLKTLGEQLGVPVFNIAGTDAGHHLQEGRRPRRRQRPRRHPLRHRRPPRHRRAADAGARGHRQVHATRPTSSWSSTR